MIHDELYSYWLFYIISLIIPRVGFLRYGYTYGAPCQGPVMSSFHNICCSNTTAMFPRLHGGRRLAAGRLGLARIIWVANRSPCLERRIILGHLMGPSNIGSLMFAL